jgi:hypothetical protein
MTILQCGIKEKKVCENYEKKHPGVCQDSRSTLKSEKFLYPAGCEADDWQPMPVKMLDRRPNRNQALGGDFMAISG